MENIFVGRVMSTPVQTVHHTETLQQAAKTMQTHDIGSVIITDQDDEYLGILTATDCIEALADNVDTTQNNIHNYITTSIATTRVNANLQRVAELMLNNQIHHVPVVDADNYVVGIVTTTDITAYLSHVEEPTPEMD